MGAIMIEFVVRVAVGIAKAVAMAAAVAVAAPIICLIGLMKTRIRK